MDEISKEDLAYINDKSIEILTNEDSKIKEIGEILANDVSRKVLMKIYEGKKTASEISRALEISLPLTVYHLKKLERCELVKISHIGKSEKNKEMNHYVPRKLAIVLIPSSVNVRHTLYSILGIISRKLLLPVSFVISSLLVYSITKLDFLPGVDFGRTVMPINNDPLMILISNIDLIIALSIGGTTAWIISRFKQRQKKSLKN